MSRQITGRLRLSGETVMPDVHNRNDINKINTVDVLDVETFITRRLKNMLHFVIWNLVPIRVCGVQVQLLWFRSKG